MRNPKSRWFLVLIILCIILIGLGNTERGRKFQLRAASIFSPLSSWVSFLFNEFKIRHENRVLKAKVSELALRNQLLASLQQENEKLLDLLEFKAQVPYKLIPARVVSREPNPISATCLIDKGLVNGVEKNSPVITPDGVYGKVLEVTKDRAMVQTLFNFNFRVAVMNLRNGTQGIVQWEGGKGCILGQVRVNSDIRVGDIIITSGIGSIFPKGLQVGKVREINVDKAKLFYEISLEPACKWTGVEHVFIVKKEVSEAGYLSTLIYKTPGWKISEELEKGEVKEEKKEVKKRPPKKEEEFPAEFRIPEPAIRTPE